MTNVFKARGGLASFALALAFLLACVPAASALAADGSVALGVAVSKKVSEASPGASGSVDIGIDVGHAVPPSLPVGGSEGGSVPIGLDLAYVQRHTVTLVGVFCDDAGNMTDERVTLAVQEVNHGGRATEPKGVDLDDGEHWADAWYAENPSANSHAERVVLSEYEVTDDTVLFCLWKKGYAVRLDANNGTAERGGEVELPGCVTVKRDAEYDAKVDANGGKVPAGVTPPDGVLFADMPAATRPGYEFKGWYWSTGESGAYGSAELDETEGMVAPEAGEGGSLDWGGRLTYDFIRKHNGDTLYAKWEPVPGVRVELENSCSEHRSALWFWPGRGYTLKAPTADLELEEGSVVSAPGEIGIAVDHNPEPAYNTQYFSGWGYADAVKEGDAYQDDRLVDCEKIEGEDGTAAGYTYRLTDRAFMTYVDDELNWVDTSYTTVDEATGVRTTTWVPLAATAHIRVSAPFEVTFQKAGAGYDYEKGEGAVLPYSVGELEAGGWIQSLPQGFKNTSERAVYVSRVDCVNVGASAILPGGHGKKIFSLYDGAREPGTDAFPDTGAALPFGYSTAGNANVGTADFRDEESWIVLPVLAEGERWSKQLYYGLDLDAAGFDRAAIAMGDPDGDVGYVAKIANVKYTYSVVP